MLAADAWNVPETPTVMLEILQNVCSVQTSIQLRQQGVNPYMIANVSKMKL